jgi:hypothetical protein
MVWSLALVAACRPGADVVRPKVVATPASAKPTASSPPAVVLHAPADTLKLGGRVAIDAGYLVSHNGGNLISNNGSTVLAVGGAIISGNGANYRLAAAPPGELPAYGMAVEALALPDLRALAVAEDQDGKPVKLVYTGKDGTFQLFLPAKLANKVVLRAHVPGSDDPRARVQLLTSAGASAEQVLDEDTTLATSYLLDGFVSRVREILTTDDPDKVLASITQSSYPDPIKEALGDALRELNQAGEEAGLRTAPPEVVERVATLVTRIVVDRVDLPAVMITEAFQPGWPLGPAPALETLTASMRAAREAASAKLAQDPAYFSRQPYMHEPYRVLKGADLVDFAAREYLFQTVLDSGSKVTEVYLSLGLPVSDEAHDDVQDKLFAGANSLFLAFAQALILDQGGAKADALAAIRQP